MSTDDTGTPDVSLADVAAEDPQESVAHEAAATDGDAAGGAEQESVDAPPEQPTLSSMLGVGPVADGDEPVI